MDKSITQSLTSSTKLSDGYDLEYIAGTFVFKQSAMQDTAVSKHLSADKIDVIIVDTADIADEPPKLVDQSLPEMYRDALNDNVPVLGKNTNVAIGYNINGDRVKTIDSGKVIRYYNMYGSLDRDEKLGPAVIHPNGCYVYYQDGKIHRDEDKPAAKYNDGELVYYRNNMIHRDEKLGPTVIYPDGSYRYYKNNVYHRDADEPAVFDVSEYICNVSKTMYYRDGKLHRDNDNTGMPQPAITMHNGSTYYYRNGKLHNELGPASIKYRDGKLHSYEKWLDGVFISEMKFD